MLYTGNGSRHSYVLILPHALPSALCAGIIYLHCDILSQIQDLMETKTVARGDKRKGNI